MNDLVPTRAARIDLGLRPGEWLYLAARFPIEFPRGTRIAGRMFWSHEDLEKIRSLRAKIRHYGVRSKRDPVRLREARHA